jgi:hypothetical protein
MHSLQMTESMASVDPPTDTEDVVTRATETSATSEHSVPTDNQERLVDTSTNGAAAADAPVATPDAPIGTQKAPEKTVKKESEEESSEAQAADSATSEVIAAPDAPEQESRSKPSATDSTIPKAEVKRTAVGVEESKGPAGKERPADKTPVTTAALETPAAGKLPVSEEAPAEKVAEEEQKTEQSKKAEQPVQEKPKVQKTPPLVDAFKGVLDGLGSLGAVTGMQLLNWTHLMAF